MLPQSPLAPVLPETVASPQYWQRLLGSASSLALQNVLRQHTRSVLLITDNHHHAKRYMDELTFYQTAATPSYFPSWEHLPYDNFSPHQDIISARLKVLSCLLKDPPQILLAPVDAVLARLLPVSYLHHCCLSVRIGQILDFEQFKASLVTQGYQLVGQIMMHGEVAVRGSLIDLFPMGEAFPYRIDLLDNEVESIRSFDPETQRSMVQVDKIEILPAREVALSAGHIACFRENWVKHFNEKEDPEASPTYVNISQGFIPAQIEQYLPLFFETTSTLFDYLPNDCLLIIDEAALSVADAFFRDAQVRYQQALENSEHYVLPPEQLFITPEILSKKISECRRIHLVQQCDAERGVTVYASSALPPLGINTSAQRPLGLLQQFVAGFSGRILIAVETAGRQETILALLQEHDLDPQPIAGWVEFLNSEIPLAITIADIQHGLLINSPSLAVITEDQLFSGRVAQKRLRKKHHPADQSALREALSLLTPGMPVVHEAHGIGLYRGLVTLEIGEDPQEFILLEYAREDKLYVPVLSLDLISRYIGPDPEQVLLHRLGSGHWQKARKKAAQQAHDVACELLELHARRAAKNGYSFEMDKIAYQQFAEQFPFEETPAQIAAIDAVLEDMISARPMDRLICGDAGFGKTEVALRAAFVAVQNSKQVAILVPTTLLAEQHYQTFSERFAEFPVRIGLLSRFRDNKSQQKTLAALHTGGIDIVIGTHRLLQKDIQFARLGLVIIDEEHRFGVRQKEACKALRAEVDILTLTATPIPRTLNIALSSLKDLSLISTPPAQRMAIKTMIYTWDESIIRDALMREIARGGQVYFLHNDIDSIEKMVALIRTLLPEIKVAFAHGKMPEKQLESVMADFYHARFSVLVCTTIIESGIDVPNANTIIINRADKFGLAQLYQLRGRVGRSHHRAFAYLLTPPGAQISAEAEKRLQAMVSLEQVSVGFSLATHDLEIRGAGELLGSEQSGQIHGVGYGLYMDLLARAVQALKTGQLLDIEQPFSASVEINIHAPALIPEDYLPDMNQRLVLYKRIAATQDDVALIALREEIIDRFGPLPETLLHLLLMAPLKWRASMLGIRKIDASAQICRLYFNEAANVDINRIIQLVQNEPQIYQLSGQNKLSIVKVMPEISERIKMLADLLLHLRILDAA